MQKFSVDHLRMNIKKTLAAAFSDRGVEVAYRKGKGKRFFIIPVDEDKRRQETMMKHPNGIA